WPSREMFFACGGKADWARVTNRGWHKSTPAWGGSYLAPRPPPLGRPVRCERRDTARAMSEESTTPDLANRWRESADAHARGDFDAMISFFAPDAVWDSSSAGLGAYFEGVTAIRSFLEEWIASFEDYEYNQEESRDLGNGVSFA